MTQDLTHGFHVVRQFLQIDTGTDLPHQVHGDVEAGFLADEFGQLFANIARSFRFFR